jgi:protein O-mannosyl-transferase
VIQKDELKISSDAPPRTGNLTNSSWPVWACALAIIIFGALAYSNSFQGAFVFDDVEIAENASLRSLWPLWPSMFAPQNVNRPLIGLSLAINYRISGLEVWSYHAFNLLIHTLAALALFGIVRRALLSERLRERFGEKASALALVSALIWMVHPLQTQSVTYIIQRCESLMGMFYLATFYFAIRSFDSPRKARWRVATIIACVAGMMSKQVMITAPVIVLLYDYIFVSGSIKDALRKRWPLYAGLAATWIVLAALLIASPLNETAGFAVSSVTPWDYFKSEPGVIAHYLRLSIWPDSLVLDYGWPVAKSVGDIAPYATVLGAMVAATIWGAVRRKPVAFPAAWFFITIALTSTLMPFSDLAFEHRMYLPLAGVVTLVVIGGYSVGARLLSRLSLQQEARTRLIRLGALTIVTVMLASLTFLTLRRNVDYHSLLVMWEDVVRKRPENSRGYSNLGKLLADEGRMDEALVYFAKTCEINPHSPYAQNNLGKALTQMDKLAEGESHLLEALWLNPQFADAHSNLGRNLAAQGKLDEALSHINQAIEINPKYSQAYFERGLVLEKQKKYAEAVESYNLTLRLEPDMDGALIRLALALATQDDASLRNPVEAVRLAERAVRLTGGRHPVPLDALATAYAEAGRFPDAIEAAQKAIELASAAGDKKTADAIEARLPLYRDGHTRLEAKLTRN